MKQLDKLIIRAFLGPFIITLVVVVCVFLIQFLMQYFSDFLGKDLGMGIILELLFYFGVNATPQAYPLAVLLSCLIVFGNLGEHSELTAIKSAGISMVRTVMPIFAFVILLCGFAYFSNDKIVPVVNLKAYSLLYDIKRTKPGLDIKPGTFYNGLPDYSIKVTDNQDDGEYLENIIIYDHSRGRGNTDVIFAETGRMETFNNDKYMRLTLFNGKSYSEQDEAAAARRRHEAIHQFARTKFDTTIMVFDLSSFEMETTDKALFAQHYKMKDTETLNHDIDSMQLDVSEALLTNFENIDRYYRFHLGVGIPLSTSLANEKARLESGRWAPDTVDITPPAEQADSAGTPTRAVANVVAEDEDNRRPNSQNAPAVLRGHNEDKKETPEERASRLAAITTFDSALIAKVELLSNLPRNKPKIYKSAATSSRYVKNNLNVQATKIKNRDGQIRNYRVERGKKLSLAVSCFVMFLIGAPLGAIIKKGGLGIPILISIAFFIIFYIFMNGGEKWGKQGLVDPLLAVWLCNIVLLPFGLFFLRQARNDARLLEVDFYRIIFERLRKRLKKTNLSKN